MATDVEALLLRIEASATKLEKDMAKAGKTFDHGARKMEKRAAEVSNKMSSGMSVGLGRIAALVGAAFSVDKVVEASQAYTRATNALKVAGLSGDDLSKTFADLYAVAQANASPIETLVGLYSKASQAQKSLGASAGQLMEFTTAVAQSLRVSGQSAEEAQGALMQLGQTISGTNVQAEEYNSLIDGAYPLLQAAAAGIREAGGDVAKLTALVKDGQVSSKAFFYGVLAGAPTLTDKLAGSTKTLSQGWTQFTNSLVMAAGQADETLGVTRGLVGLMDDMSKSIDRNAGSFTAWVAELKSNTLGVLNPFLDVLKSIYGVITSLQETALDGVRDLPQEVIDAFPEYKVMGLKSRLGERGAKADRSRSATPTGDADQRVASAFALFDKPRETKTVSLKDYPADKKEKKGAAEKDDEYEKELAQMAKKAKSLELEIALVGKSAEEQAKAREELELKNAAEKAGIALTPEILAQIDQVASAYARQISTLEQVKKAHEDTQRAAEHLGESAVDALSDIIIEGRDAGEVMQNLAKSLAKAALQSLLMGSGPLGGLFGGGLFKGIFAGMGGATGAPLSITPFASGGVVARPTLAMAGEAGPEAFIPLSGGRVPVRLDLPSLRDVAPARATPTTITFAPVIDARGADAAQIAVLRRDLKRMADDMPKTIAGTLHRQQVRGTI